MFESPVKFIDLVKTAILSLTVIFVIFIVTVTDHQTKIVFCDVGQGDAAYIRLETGQDILIDAGPDKSVLSCLGKYMPFWDRKIELAFLSHPNADHYGGYTYITSRYKIDRFITVKDPILKRFRIKNITPEYLTSNDKIYFNYNSDHNDGLITILWPNVDFQSSTDNDYSMVMLFEINSFRLLFTGDASSYVLGRLSHGSVGKIDVLKIPHHGSKNGLTKTFLDLADPVTAVISVGKNNFYGHPSQEVLDMLKAKNTNIKRTDVDGDIVFKLTR